MKIILYLLGYIFVIILMLGLFNKKNCNLSILEKFLVLSVSLIPLGKLIYFPIPGLIGLKFAFIWGALISLVWFAINGVRKSAFVLVLALLVPIMSLIYTENLNEVFLYQLDAAQTDSTLLRLITFMLLVLYSSVIYSSIINNENIYIFLAEYFIKGTVFASLAGVFIFYFIFKGVFTENDIAPLSAGVHIIQSQGFSFYRFNPGANVNEFSMILAFSIFLMPFTRFSLKAKFSLVTIFLLLEFATLTRAAWLALLISTIISIFWLSSLRKSIKYIFVVFIIFLLIFLSLYYSSHEVQMLFDSRTSMNIGASGNERLEKFEYVFHRLYEFPYRILFGFGWATNMYVHNVYLQLLYEVGAIGLILFLVAILLFIRELYSMPKGIYKAFLVASLFFIIIVATMHHTLYHLQVWFMLGFIASVPRIVRREFLGKGLG